jgi:nicotinamidase-related amidase/isocitrate/isopropylmalate dehydrogenase
MLKVGLAVGLGTGPELAEIFTRSLRALTGAHGRRVDLVTSDRRYATYVGQLAARAPARDVARSATEDAEHYERFLADLHRAGGRVAFRTAINAQPLYRVRERLLGVKLERFSTFHGELLLVRDGAQGFYGGVNDEPGPEGVIRRTCEFRRDTTRRILDHALAEAAAAWGGVEAIDRIQMIYKFHLLDMRLAEWVDEYATEHGLTIHICQPDTANRQLAREEWRGRVLAIGANEWSDIMHAELVIKYGHGAQEERFSRNVYLHPDMDGMTEYQTVHGSADDIAGRDLVNPLATLRAAADIAEQHAGCAGVVALMETALREARAAGLVTRDMGGTTGTAALVEHVLARCADGGTAARSDGAHGPGGAGGAGGPGTRDALVLVDLQNDYCAPDGCFHRLGLIDPERTRAVAGVAERLLARARTAGVPATFVRTVHDETDPRTVRERNRVEGRAECVRRGSWGAEPFGPAPRPGDQVLIKRSYDPFLGTTLERDLRRRGASRLIVAGVFTDVCLDALSRSAYQLGFEVVVVRDGCLPLQRDQAECLLFMERFYGTRAVDSAEAATLLAAVRPDAPAEPESAAAGR